MSKQGGLGDNLYVDGYDISGDVGSLSSISGAIATTEVTGINKFAFERRGLGRDGNLEFSTWFNPDTDQGHDVLSVLPTSDTVVSYLRGTTRGNWAASMVGKQINYNWNRSNEGALTGTTQAQANGYGLEWGRQLTAGIDTHTGATEGESVDFGAATSFGLQAWLHVFTFTGTSATVKLQSSSDDGATDAFADVVDGAFTSITAGRDSERIQTARDASIERYLRVVTTGTFTELSFAVIVTKNLTEVTF